MQSRFDFLDGQLPKLAHFGKKAEESLGSDNNICLLNLGRIGEYITELICTHNRIDYDSNAVNSAHELLKFGLIDEDICRKIEALIETRKDALNSEYSSEMACNKLMMTAKELCEWFASSWGKSRFDFLADLFKPSISAPHLADLADLGREAEENLYHNTRYCLICLGDIGEAVVDMLIDIRDIHVHTQEQIEKINTLFFGGVISDPQKDTLHVLRMARNKAVHQRYASDEEGKRILNEALPLCEWIFRFVLATGDVVRGKITAIDEEAITVGIGEMTGIVPRDEIPEDNINDYYSIGERRSFRVVNAQSENIILSISKLNKNPWTVSAQHYARYSIGQDVNAIVRRISSAFGAFVELTDGLKAILPETEYNTDPNKPPIKVGQHILARIKRLNPEQYPYMILSMRDIDNADGSLAVQAQAIPQKTPASGVKLSKKLLKRKATNDKLFLNICRNSPASEVSKAITNGADIHAKNKNNMTALMMAAMYNKDPEVINVLVNGGANVNAKNKKGNTALIFAAKQNTPEVVRALCERNADVESVNNARHNALYYAMSNPKVNSDSGLMGLLGGEKTVESTNLKVIELTNGEYDEPSDSAPEEEQQKNVPEEEQQKNAPEEEQQVHTPDETASHSAEQKIQHADTEIQPINPYIDSELKKFGFPGICREGNAESIKSAIDKGADIHVTDKEKNTGLILSAEKNTPDSLRVLLDAGINAKLTNNEGNNALMTAAKSNTHEAVSVLIDATADINAVNKIGDSALIMAAKSNNDAEVVRLLIEHGANIDIANQTGSTPLIFASRYNTPEVISVLLDAGADITVQNGKGKTAYDVAQRNEKLSDSDVIERLRILKEDDDVIKEDDNVSKKDDNVSKEDDNVSKEDDNVSKITLQHDILKICKAGTPEEVSQAINAGISLTVRNKIGATPLMFAAQKNSQEIIDILIHAGAEINAQDSNGNTALIYAASSNDEYVVDALLDAGADKNIANSSGYKAVDYARRNYKLTDTNALSRLEDDN